MNRTQPTNGLEGLIDDGGIFVDRRDIVVSVVDPTYLPAREDVT
jgi:hypothetical protein